MSECPVGQMSCQSNVCRPNVRPRPKCSKLMTWKYCWTSWFHWNTHTEHCIFLIFKGRSFGCNRYCWLLPWQGAYFILRYLRTKRNFTVLHGCCRDRMDSSYGSVFSLHHRTSWENFCDQLAVMCKWIHRTCFSGSRTHQNCWRKMKETQLFFKDVSSKVYWGEC